MDPYIIIVVGILAAIIIAGGSYLFGVISTRKRIHKCMFVRCQYKGADDFAAFAIGPFRDKNERDAHIRELRVEAGEEYSLVFLDGREIDLAHETGSRSEKPKEYFSRMKRLRCKLLTRGGQTWKT